LKIEVPVIVPVFLKYLVDSSLLIKQCKTISEVTLENCWGALDRVKTTTATLKLCVCFI